MDLPILNTATSDNIVLAIANSFDNATELRTFAELNNINHEPAVQSRLDFLLLQQRSSADDQAHSSAHVSSAARDILTNRFTCVTCGSAFNSKDALNRHRRLLHKVQDLLCKKCHSRFTHQARYENHVSTCEGLTCFLCGVVFRSNEELMQHRELHTSGHIPTLYKCYDCNQVFDTQEALFKHRNIKHGGARLTEEGLFPTPWKDHPPWSPPGEAPDLELRDVYNINRRHILRPHRHNRYSTVYNFPTNNISDGMNELKKILYYVYNREEKVFRINISLGLILRRITPADPQDGGNDNNLYRYFIPFKNSNLFERPMYVGDRRGIEKVLYKLRELEIDSYSNQQRPDTSWKPFMVTNINVVVFRTSYVLGSIGILPSYIKSRRCIIGLDVNGHGQAYNDNMCIFRCLDYHKAGSVIKSRVMEYFRQWLEFKEYDMVSQDVEHFQGVEIGDFPKFEECFQTSLQIYTLYEDGSVRRVYESPKEYPDLMVLNLHHRHLSYVKNFSIYARKFSCSMCSRSFKRIYNLARHMRTCVDGIKLRFKGGFFKRDRNVFEELESFGIYVTDTDRHYPYFIVFDFEAYLVEQNDLQCGKLIWEQEHKPLSVSIASNVPGYESPYCIVSANESKLMEDALSYMHKIAEAVSLLVRKKFEYVISRLSNQSEEWTELFNSSRKVAQKSQPTVSDAFEGCTSDNVCNYAEDEARPACTTVDNECVTEDAESSSTDSKRSEDRQSFPPRHKRKLSRSAGRHDAFEAASNFIDECVDVDDGENDECDEYDTIEDGYDLSDTFIDDDNDEIDQHVTEYRRFDNILDASIDAPALEKERQDKTESNSRLESNTNPFTIMINQITQLHQKFLKYCDQVPTLAFNSSKYDLNLIKSQFLHHMCLSVEDESKVRVIKNRNAYLLIESDVLRFLDVSRYLSAGCSYSKFLKAFDISEQKSYFPYDWLDSPDKLSETHLPSYEAFHSKLRGCNLLEIEMNGWDGTGTRPQSGEEKYARLCDIWHENGMQTMQDFLVYYNNLDTGPFVNAVERLLEFYTEMGVDLFKEAMSVAGIARVLMFKNAEKAGNFFTSFGYEDEDLYHIYKQNVVGGPSIVFHRYHEVGKTKIRGKKECNSIVGFDANALYPFCLSQQLPCFVYVRRLVTQDFKPNIPYRNLEMYFWMEFLNKTENLNIRHRLNFGEEKRIGPYLVDGFDPNTNTVYEFHGCWFHGHIIVEPDCTKTRLDERYVGIMKARYYRSFQRQDFIEDRSYKYVQIWECEFSELRSSDDRVNDVISYLLPAFYFNNRGSITQEHILESVLDESLYGACEVDIMVPHVWEDELTEANKHRHSFSPYEYFAEMSPLFCTVKIPFSHIGNHMQTFVNENGLSQQSRKCLVGGMAATKILLATPLLKWYLEHGLIVSYVYQVVEFSPVKCFSEFLTGMNNTRREADRSPDKRIIGESMKLLSNSCYGGLLLDRSKHTRVNFVRGEDEVVSRMNEPRFINMSDLGQELYEVEVSPKTINMCLPIQVPFTVLQLAKLHILAFTYDMVDVYVDRADYQLIQMDTDSAYLALSGKSFRDVVREDKVADYVDTIDKSCSDDIQYIPDFDKVWFPRECCTNHMRTDARTQGLFKKEAEGSLMVALASKCYILQTADSYKLSCKGVNKQLLEQPVEKFRSVMTTKQPVTSVNRGFMHHKNTIFTYKQDKQAFSYFYCKRQILEDGVSTIPLELTLTPGLGNDIVTFNVWHILSPYFIQMFVFNSLTFQTIYQCLLYLKVVHHKRRDLIGQVMVARHAVQLNAVDELFKTDTSWRVVLERKLVDICIAKASQIEDVRKFLNECGVRQLIFADYYNSVLGCGLSEKLAGLRPVISHPGNNLMGIVWKSVQAKLLA